MSRHQNITPSDELAKRKTKIVDMERELVAEHERVRKEEEEEERAREAAEARRRAATVLQQQARENRSCVELPQCSVLPVASCSRASRVIVLVHVIILLQHESHSVEVMVYQYDKLFGYGWWMTSILTITHIFIFLGYSEIPSWLPWQPIQILQYPKSIPQNIKMWVMVGILVIQ